MDNVIIELIHADKVAAINTLQEARKEGRKCVDITPQCICPADTISLCLRKISPGERIKVKLPRCFTHFGGVDECDWDTVREIKEEFAGQYLEDGKFLVVRHDEEGESVVVDICCHE